MANVIKAKFKRLSCSVGVPFERPKWSRFSNIKERRGLLVKFELYTS